MRTKLRVAALLVALAVIAWWFFGGHNFGWDQNYVLRNEVDALTGIPKPIEDKRFIPGYEFLAKGLGLAALLGAASFFFRRKPKAGEPGRVLLDAK